MLDLDHLTPEQAAVYRRAVAEYQERFGFSMEVFTEVLEHDLNFDEIMVDADRTRRYRVNGLWVPVTYEVED